MGLAPAASPFASTRLLPPPPTLPLSRAHFHRAPPSAVYDVEFLTTHTQPHDAWVVRNRGSEKLDYKSGSVGAMQMCEGEKRWIGHESLVAE